MSQKSGGDVLFLDFDGVCNSFETGSYLTHEPKDYGYDPKIVARIREICDRAGARVVISSNWRRFPPDGVWPWRGMPFSNPLGGLYAAIGDLVAGTLPRDRHITKAQAVELWFEDNPGFGGRFAIVDDDPNEGIQDVPSLKGSFWLVDRRWGITDSIKDGIVAHLNARK